MERRSFVKNIFGSIIGFAVFPTAITEFSSAPEVIESNVTFDVSNRFCVGDVIVTQDGEQYLIVSRCLDEMKGRNLSKAGKWITLNVWKDNKVTNLRLLSRSVGEGIRKAQ